eukprot:2309757-Pleurochrysis_carterae.AAC.5
MELIFWGRLFLCVLGHFPSNPHPLLLLPFKSIHARSNDVFGLPLPPFFATTLHLHSNCAYLKTRPCADGQRVLAEMNEMCQTESAASSVSVQSDECDALGMISLHSAL